MLEEALLGRRLRAAPWVVITDPQSLATAHRLRDRYLRPMGHARVGSGETVSLTRQFTILRPAELPDALRVTVAFDGGAASRTFAVQTFAGRTPLRLPVAGHWQVLSGHRFDEPHGQALLLSQSFAYDLAVAGPEGLTHAGDRRMNAAYHAHGRPVLAAADGEVVLTLDGQPENEPVGRRPELEALLRSPLATGGNLVVLRHASGEHTAYFHLRPGLGVRRGQLVRAGDRLGACGNSGNSAEPHLHLQLQDGPDPMRARGLPARFGDFTMRFGQLALYVPPEQPMPLPTGLLVHPGRLEGAIDIGQLTRRSGGY
ncbi:MAG: M23 family metallopeptidase [Deltaproteobacteria bacterium]|nr:M23 family metallopeptidase [Deltaproteobacteria bacterium]